MNVIVLCFPEKSVVRLNLNRSFTTWPVITLIIGLEVEDCHPHQRNTHFLNVWIQSRCGKVVSLFPITTCIPWLPSPISSTVSIISPISCTLSTLPFAPFPDHPVWVCVCVCVSTHFTCFTSTKVQMLSLLCVSDGPHLLQVDREPTTRIYIYSYLLLIFTNDFFYKRVPYRTVGEVPNNLVCIKLKLVIDEIRKKLSSRFVIILVETQSL